MKVKYLSCWLVSVAALAAGCDQQISQNHQGQAKTVQTKPIPPPKEDDCPSGLPSVCFTERNKRLTRLANQTLSITVLRATMSSRSYGSIVVAIDSTADETFSRVNLSCVVYSNDTVVAESTVWIDRVGANSRTVKQDLVSLPDGNNPPVNNAQCRLIDAW
jgi:hypothetical protein